MDRIDNTDHFEQAAAADPPSLLVVILDTNPFAWAQLHDTLPLSTALSHVLLFLNTHLAFSYANQVAVIASHTQSASFLYPSVLAAPPSTSASSSSWSGSGAPPPPSSSNGSGSAAAAAARDANKYRKFRDVEDAVQASLRKLMADTSPEGLAATGETMIAGALSLALAYINRVTNAATGGAGGAAALRRAGEDAGEVGKMDARILVVSVSGDLANQYVSVMNSIFAAQRQKVPIDICKIAGDTVFLQQASDSTNGIYMQLDNPGALLQYLLTAFIPDTSTRKHLVSPSQINVDFRAACFCHKRVVDVGFVCSICLSSGCPEYLQFRDSHLARLRRQAAEDHEYELFLERERARRQRAEANAGHSWEEGRGWEEESLQSWQDTVQDDLSGDALDLVDWWFDTVPQPPSDTIEACIDTLN